MRVSRRQLICQAAVSAASAAACSRRVPGRQKRTLAGERTMVLRCHDYGAALDDAVRRMLAELRLNVRGKRIVLKPNLVEFDSQTAINTHPAVVHAAYEAFRSAGAAEVRIAEGPGHRSITLDLAEAAGYFEYFPQFERLFTDLNRDDVALTRLGSNHSGLAQLYLPKTVLACDLLVSMPKLKTHHWAGATAGMKNLFGVVPGAVYGWPKNVLHWAGIHESVADLYNTFPRTFAIVDGVVGMEGNGPIQGTPKRAGLLLAGRDLAAVDIACLHVMGLQPAKVGYLQLAVGETAAAGETVQVGETLRTVQQPFRVLPQFEFLRA